MAFTNEELRSIYDRTTGYCHLCRKKLAFRNYGTCGARQAWEVEHSNAQANGGTHRRNNLYAACIPCNRSKSRRSTRSARAENGYTTAPLSKAARKAEKRWNQLGGAAAGALAGLRFGPIGALIGAAVGAAIGNSVKPDR